MSRGFEPSQAAAVKPPAVVPSSSAPPTSLLVTVIDENHVPVPSAQVRLTGVPSQLVSKGETDYAGRFKFVDLTPGAYRLDAQKEGFYAVNLNEVRVGETEGVEVTLNHPQEYVESVDVTYSPPAIDPAKTVSTQDLTSREIIDLPYGVPRDVRYALPLLPGVLQDPTGQIHVNGSSTRMVLDQLDGFNITDPSSGLFKVRVGVEALRSVDLQTSRVPAEFGKASGGILSLNSSMGDDRYRFSGTDFLPSLQNRRGLHIATWTPRGAFSGPLRRGKAWFLLAPEGEYDLTVIRELPPGGDRNSAWRVGNLAKAQVNLTSSNILTTSFLVNEFRDSHAGLTRFDPLSTTTNLKDSVYLLSAKDQLLLSSGLLVEYGFAASRFRNGEVPLGQQAYVITPEGTSGNFFETAAGRSGRYQGIANFILPAAEAHGRHEFKLGADLNRLTYHQAFARTGISILREDRTLSRSVSFPGKPSYGQDNTEASAYAEDHWAVSDRVLVDAGLRFDWDEIVHGLHASPRLASSLLVTARGDTKLVVGVGSYYDASNLELFTRPLEGQRVDLFYDPTGHTLVRPPVTSVFQVDPAALRASRFLNWSAGVEQKIADTTHFRLEYIQKRGHDGWTYLNPCAGPLGCFAGQFLLSNARRDRYDALEITVRRTFRKGHLFFASYTRSASRSNAVLNFNIFNPVFSPQAAGPFSWDAPNRLLSRGLLPLWHGFDLAYTLDARSGFPFNVVNQDQQLVGPPGSRRFPAYFSLNAALEKRVHALGYQWALRAGFSDITNRHNPDSVNNNIDSPQFLTFGSAQTRAFTGQIRLVGRK